MFLQYISYESLLKELDVKNIRELEDLLISAIYADIIQGRLDQQNSRLVAPIIVTRILLGERALFAEPNQADG